MSTQSHPRGHIPRHAVTGAVRRAVQTPASTIEEPEAEGEAAMIDWPAVVFWWSIYAIVIMAFVIHLAAG